MQESSLPRKVIHIDMDAFFASVEQRDDPERRGTDEDGSGFTRNDEFNAISYYVETGDPLFTAADDTDGRNLADALRIDYAPLQFLRNSDATDHREAVAMNTTSVLARSVTTSIP